VSAGKSAEVTAAAAAEVTAAASSAVPAAGERSRREAKQPNQDESSESFVHVGFPMRRTSTHHVHFWIKKSSSQGCSREAASLSNRLAELDEA
jgi:hypothetical protein